MDAPSIISRQSSESRRRKLVKKKPPSHVQARSSAGLDAGVDDQSILSHRSSNSLTYPRTTTSSTGGTAASSTTTAEGAPAPAATSTDAAHYHSSSQAPSQTHYHQSHPATSLSSSSPRHPQPPLAFQSFGDSGILSGSLFPTNPESRPSRHSDSLSHPVSDDLIGAPFDGAAILKRLEATKLSASQASQPSLQHSLSLQRPHIPPPLDSSISGASSTRVPNPPVPGAATTFAAMDLSEKSLTSRTTGDSFSSIKRQSDDGKDGKGSVLRKKTGLSSLMNSLVGSQKKPVISAPEKPVHVTHVGYDSTTGQFTVRIYNAPPFMSPYDLSYPACLVPIL
jgi:p21-activated kinase 1